MAIKRTTMNIDTDLVARAQEILGAGTATATVHEALQEVVRRQSVRQLMEWDFGHVDPRALKALRRPRGFEQLDDDARDAS